MTIAVSTNYRRLDASEVPTVAAECDAAWQDPAIPLRQWTSCVRAELDRYRNGQALTHFESCVRAMKKTGLENPSILDAGSSGGYYSEVLRIAQFPCRYTALDYSVYYERLSRDLYPAIDFQLGDVRSLPFPDSSFDIVLSSAVLMHVYEYETALAEAARVASQFVVLHRTPVTGETQFYQKEAYGVSCLEIHFGEEELLDLFSKHGLGIVSQEDIFVDAENNFCHRTYLLRKESK